MLQAGTSVAEKKKGEGEVEGLIKGERGRKGRSKEKERRVTRKTDGRVRLGE